MILNIRVIVTRCARLWGNFHHVWSRSTYPFLAYSVFCC